MPYQIKLTNRTEREAKIRASVAASTETQEFFDFRGTSTRLKVIRVEIDLPIYRMENCRAFTEQKAYTNRERKPANFFQNGQENESVQQLQHEILANLARAGREGSVTPVIDVLRKERQREPLLITHTGVVVNGNRRLAAMRELLREGPSGITDYSYVSCMVLPEDTTPDEIDDIEASLQAKPETRLDYDWIGDCQLIKKQQSKGRDARAIAEKLNRNPKEISNSLQALTEAELYLREWVRAEGDYSRVSAGEQFFKDLPDLLKNKSQQLQEGSRVIAWTLYENREELGDRLYAFNLSFGKRAADVLERVADSIGLPLEQAPPAEGEFAIDLESDGEISYAPLVEALRDPERKEEAIQSVIEACQGVIESEKNQRSGNAALKAVTAAHSKLAEVDLSRAASSTYSAIDKQLDGVIRKATELKNRLAEYRTPE